MKWSILGGALAVGCVMLAHTQAQGPKSQLAVKHGWLLNYEQGRALARKTGKPLMVVFRCEP